MCLRFSVLNHTYLRAAGKIANHISVFDTINWHMKSGSNLISVLISLFFVGLIFTYAVIAPEPEKKDENGIVTASSTENRYQTDLKKASDVVRRVNLEGGRIDSVINE
jgi:hypothetical protein